MIRLVGTNKLQVVLSGAATASRVTVSYMDFTATATTGDTQLSVTNGATPVDICAAPAASTTRQVDHIRLVALAAMTAIFSINDGTARDWCKTVLALGDVFDWSHSGGAKVIDANGNTKTVVSGAIAATTLAVSGDSVLTGDLAVNGGDLTTTATTFNLLAANATTVNAFGAASVALNIGHVSAAANFVGGAAIPTGKTLSGAGAINISGAITGAAISGTTGTYTGKLTLTGAIAGGPPAGTGYVGADATNGVALIGRGSAGDVTLYNYGGSIAAYVPSGTQNFNVNGTLGVTGVITLANGVSLQGRNAADNNYIDLISSTPTSDRVSIGGTSTSIDGKNLPRIAYWTAAAFPTGAAADNGVIAVDGTNNRFVFFSGGARYYVTGTTF